MACASALTQLAQGKTIAEAEKIRREDVVNAVGGLPEGLIHASQLAIAGLLGLLRQVAV